MKVNVSIKGNSNRTQMLNLILIELCIYLKCLNICFKSNTLLTLRSISSLNNPQTNEMKFCENMKLTC